MVTIMQENKELIYKGKGGVKVDLVRSAPGLCLSVENTPDKAGIIYGITSVLYARDWNIVSLSAEVNEDGDVHDLFIIEKGSDLSPLDLFIERRKLLEDLQEVLETDTTVMRYLSGFPVRMEKLKRYEKKKLEKRTEAPYLDLEALEGGLFSLRIETKDRPGLIFSLSRVLFHFYFDIVSMGSDTRNGRAFDLLYLRRLDEKAGESDKEILLEALKRAI